MIKQTVSYTDYEGNPQVRDFYFHLSKTEALELYEDGTKIEDKVKLWEQTGDNRIIFALFKELIGAAAGSRSEDGQLFIKTPEAKAPLMYSPAYDELVFSVLESAETAARFFNGLFPADMAKKLAEISEKNASNESAPAWVRENRQPTQEEITKMSRAELNDLFAGRYGTKK